MFCRRLRASRCWCVFVFAFSAVLERNRDKLFPRSSGFERAAQAHGRRGHLGSTHGAGAYPHMDTPVAAAAEGMLRMRVLPPCFAKTLSCVGPFGCALRSNSSQAVVCAGRLAPKRRLCACSAVSVAPGVHGSGLGGVALPMHSAQAWLGAVAAGHQSRRPEARASAVDVGLGCRHPGSPHGHAAGAGAHRLHARR